MLTDTAQHYGGLMLRCCVSFLGRELSGATLASQGASWFSKCLRAHCKTNVEHYFWFSSFFGKSKNPPLISCGWWKQILVYVFYKSEVMKSKLLKSRDTCESRKVLFFFFFWSKWTLLEECTYLTKYEKLKQQICFKDTEMRLAQGNSAGCLSFFLSFFFWPCRAACGIYFPHQGLNPLPPIFKYAFLTTRLLGKSQQYVFLYSCSERLPVNLCMISLILARLVPNYNKCVTGLSRIRWKVHQTR